MFNIFNIGTERTRCVIESNLNYRGNNLTFRVTLRCHPNAWPRPHANFVKSGFRFWKKAMNASFASGACSMAPKC